MHTIRDDDLILYHYRDGLSPGELDDITVALAASGELRERYRRLCGLLAAVDAAGPQPADAGLESRLWSRLESRIAGSGPAPQRVGRSAHSGQRRPRRRQWWAIAAAATLVLAVGFLGGRLSAPLSPETPVPVDSVAATEPAASSSLATRALDAYVASHLRTTEGLLLGASLGDDTHLDMDDAALAAALVDSNRLYAAAAARAGNARLAGFLQQLEPVLIELANPPAGTRIERHEGLREFIDDADLLFQLRATETQLRTRHSISS